MCHNQTSTKPRTHLSTTHTTPQQPDLPQAPNQPQTITTSVPTVPTNHNTTQVPRVPFTHTIPVLRVPSPIPHTAPLTRVPSPMMHTAPLTRVQTMPMLTTQAPKVHQHFQYQEKQATYQGCRPIPHLSPAHLLPRYQPYYNTGHTNPTILCMFIAQAAASTNHAYAHHIAAAAEDSSLTPYFQTGSGKQGPLEEMIGDDKIIYGTNPSQKNQDNFSQMAWAKKAVRHRSPRAVKSLMPIFNAQSDHRKRKHTQSSAQQEETNSTIHTMPALHINSTISDAKKGAWYMGLELLPQHPDVILPVLLHPRTRHHTRNMRQIPGYHHRRQRLRLLWDLLWNVWTQGSRSHSIPPTQKMTQTTRLWTSTINNRTLETYNKTNNIRPLRWRFWCKILHTWWRATSHQSSTRNIRSHSWLDRTKILWTHHWLALYCQTDPIRRHLYVKLLQKSPR